MDKPYCVYNVCLRNRKFLLSVFSSTLLLFFSLVVNYYLGQFATEKASNSVTDLILSNIPVFNINGIFIYGPLIFWSISLLFCFSRPHAIPFTIKSIAVFILIRSCFISLTHLGPFPSVITVAPSIFINKFSFSGDLFFSGHTGLPFLLALIFWESKPWRYFFIISSVFFGTIVLLGHLHYSIDVLSAFFITYTIYHIVKTFFKKDFKLFKEGFTT